MTPKFKPLNHATYLADVAVAGYVEPTSIAKVTRGWVSAVTMVGPVELLAANRHRPAVEARTLWARAMVAAGQSYASTGRAMHRDHSTVMHAVSRTIDPALQPYSDVAVSLGIRLAAAVIALHDGEPVPVIEVTPPLTMAEKAAERSFAHCEARRAAIKERAEGDAVARGKLRAALHPREFRPLVGDYIADAGLLARPPTAAVMADLRLAMLREAGVIPA